ncbi:hypothetical protein MEZE111188_05635 [Mesobacillus zeae]
MKVVTIYNKETHELIASVADNKAIVKDGYEVMITEETE